MIVCDEKICMNRIYLSEVKKMILKTLSASPSGESQFSDLPLAEDRKAICRLRDCGLVKASDTKDTHFVKHDT